MIVFKFEVHDQMGLGIEGIYVICMKWREIFRCNLQNLGQQVSVKNLNLKMEVHVCARSKMSSTTLNIFLMNGMAHKIFSCMI